MEVCPKQAIEIKDTLNSYNAVINDIKCVNCNACHKICPQNNKPRFKATKLWLQGWSLDSIIRQKSSSGGAAAVLSIGFINAGGIVCSCKFIHGEFVFDFASDVESIGEFSGSKYVKSNAYGAYSKIKALLSIGKKVLFIGLPCQVAAAINIVGEKLMANLYTIDLICHGTPSPQVLNLFLEQKNYSLNDFKNIQFRKNTTYQIYDEQKTIGVKGKMDSYSIAFLNALSFTDNCYSCQFATNDRISDLTIGDSWGTELPLNEQKKGISLILCQTEKGKQLIDSSDMYLVEVDKMKSISNNRQLSNPVDKPLNRDRFFELIKSGKKMDFVLLKLLPYITMKQLIKGCCIKAKLYKT